ncbi:MAG: lactate utilization protein [Aestuariivirgaceae bacterium]|nr:lactate utilization protein [Aestuariivirgaceae bacterium]
MADTRADILARIRRNLKVSGDETARRETIANRMKTHPRGPVPARGAGGLDTFRAMAQELDATTEIITSRDAIPQAVGDYLRARNLPQNLRHGTDEYFAGLNWQGITTAQGAAIASDETSLSHAFAGVAETGTLVLLSGPENPTTLNFLPENHIVVLEADKIYAAYEDTFDRVRAAHNNLPRTLNFITGPSRTADVEQTIELGAHGPRRLHIIIVQ